MVRDRRAASSEVQAAGEGGPIDKPSNRIRVSLVDGRWTTEHLKLRHISGGDDGVQRFARQIRRIANDTTNHSATWLQATEWIPRYICGSQILT
ncbi:hypothetical protein HAX54_025883, partial [Datura stramonium]|nr:hypothetical protein [Datura stramonium]